jgi:hypothetical protein
MEHMAGEAAEPHQAEATSINPTGTAEPTLSNQTHSPPTPQTPSSVDEAPPPGNLPTTGIMAQAASTAFWFAAGIVILLLSIGVTQLLDKEARQ